MSPTVESGFGAWELNEIRVVVGSFWCFWLFFGSFLGFGSRKP